jgi:hypothetical protein
MKGAGPLPGLDVDPCSLAILLALVTGLAAIADPALTALSFVLVALGLAAFMIGLRPRHSGRLGIDARTVAAVSILTLGAVAFFLAPSDVAPVRALLLALSATPLWWVHRRVSPAPWGGPA